MNELLEQLQEFRKILCICPCCGEIVRVSDLRLKLKGTTVKTWLDEYQNKEQEIQKKEERFGEREEKLREIAREKGRKEAGTLAELKATLKYKNKTIELLNCKFKVERFSNKDYPGFKDMIYTPIE